MDPTSHFRTSLPSLTRHVVVIHNAQLAATMLGKRERARMADAQASINRSVRDASEQLWEATRRSFPRFSTQIFGRTDSLYDVVKAVLSVDLRPHETRAVGFYRGHTDDSAMSQERIGLSHLVTVSLDSEQPPMWRPGGRLAGAHVIIPPERFAELLHDIFLDIVMFYSRRALALKHCTLDQRISLSEQKADFAQQAHLECRYGPVSFDSSDDRLRYYALAASTCCWQYGTFSPEAYEQLWDEFERYTDLGAPDSSDGQQDQALTTDLSLAPTSWRQSDPLRHILRNHRFGGQISKRRLAKALALLASGHYLLVMPRRRPHVRSRRESILRLFGRNRWNQRMWKVITYDRRASFDVYREFLTYFAFEVP